MKHFSAGTLTIQLFSSTLAAMVSVAPPCRAQVGPGAAPPVQPSQPATTNDLAPLGGAPATPPDVARDPKRRQQDRALARRRQMEARMRGMMTAFGFTDEGTQRAIIEHIEGEERAMNPVRARARALLQAIQNEATPPQQVVVLLGALRETLELDRTRRKKAQADLDTQINYSGQPRLEGFLILLGVLGDGPTFVSLRGGMSGPPASRSRPNPPSKAADSPYAAPPNVAAPNISVNNGAEPGEAAVENLQNSVPTQEDE